MGFQWPYYLYVPRSWREGTYDLIRSGSSAPIRKKSQDQKKSGKKSGKLSTKKKSSAAVKSAAVKKTPPKKGKKSAVTPEAQAPLTLTARARPKATKKLYLLVLPNLTPPNDDFRFHENEVKGNLSQLQQWGDALHVAVLRPVFPRTRKDARVHTQALDRDSLLIRDGTLQRLDLQLVAMIDHARERLQRFQLEVEPLVLLWGFGESALFVNRFALLHPERVKGAAIGAPGGWFMAPSSRHSGKDLRYPVGVSDLPGLVDRSFFRQAFQKEPLFLYLGDRDKTDLLSRSDAYDPQDRDLILSLFGQTPLQRWNETIELYRRADCNCVFQLYEGVDHDYPDWVTEDVMTFLKEQMR